MIESSVLKSRALGIGIVIAAMVILLRSMGRSWWCKCGVPIPWSWDIWSSHASQHLIDPYFFSHVLHGVIFFRVLHWVKPIPTTAKWIVAALVEAGWEILENSPLIIERYRESTISLDYFGDSIANSIFDVVACLIGFGIASKVRWTTSIAFFIAVEVVLLITIRDSLVLNIIMLISPIEAILTWQNAGR